MSCMKHVSDTIVETVFNNIQSLTLQEFIVTQLFKVKETTPNLRCDDRKESFEIRCAEFIDLEAILLIIKRFCWLKGFETFIQTTSGYKSEKFGQTMLITISQSNSSDTFNTWISISYQPFSLLDLLIKKQNNGDNNHDRN